MRVIVLTSSKSISGGLRQALYLAEGFAKQGHVVYFVCPAGGASNALARQTGLNTVHLPPSIIQTEKTLRALMSVNEPTVLHAFHNKGVKLAAYLGTYWRILGLPIACVAHRGVTSRPGNPLPYLLPGIRKFLVNSQACADTLPLLWRKNCCHVVNNSIPENRLIPLRSKHEVLQVLKIPAGYNVIGNVCNNNPLKGAGQALRAFALARPTLPPSKLVLVGAKPEDWQPLCAELGIAEDVRLVAHTNHVADYMQLMDILIFPSQFIESQPNVVIEAMSMGVPVIAGDIGGINELLPAEFLFDPQNVLEISEKLSLLMRSPEALKRIGELNAQERDKFSVKKRIEVLNRYYLQALSEAPAPPEYRSKNRLRANVAK